MTIAPRLAAATEAESRAAVVAFSDPSTPDEASRAMRDEVAAAFARAAAYGGVKVLDAASVANTLSGSEARDRAGKLDAAMTQAKRARALYAQLDFEQAAKEFEGARDGMTAALAGQTDGALADVLLDLAQADLDLRRTEAAHDAFRQARVYGAPETLAASYTPKSAAAYRDAIVSLKSRTGAALQVLTSPAGAKISVDGRFAGVSPFFATGLVDGPHVVRADLPAAPATALPAVEVVTLSVGKTAKVSLSLPTAPPEGADRGLRTGSPEEELRSALAAGDALKVDLLLATGIVRGGEGPRVRTLLVDVKRRTLVAAVTAPGDPTEKDVLDKAGAGAGARAKEYLKNAPPVAAAQPLRFEEVRTAR